MCPFSDRGTGTQANRLSLYHSGESATNMSSRLNGRPSRLTPVDQDETVELEFEHRGVNATEKPQASPLAGRLRSALKDHTKAMAALDCVAFYATSDAGFNKNAIVKNVDQHLAIAASYAVKHFA